MSNHFEKYLEKIGVRYVLGLGTLSYILGTAVFNIYLRSLGVYEFNLLQLRYMFVGILFELITFGLVFLIFILWRLVLYTQKKKKKPTKRQRELFWRRIEMIMLVFILPWMFVYARYVLPTIPSGFGGAKPIIARLVGDPQEIQRINELIAYETNLQPEKLPFEMAPGRTDLAIGANVLILDQNRDRLFLLLTKELYLSSTSRLAQQLQQAGSSIASLQTGDTKDFKIKPLIVNSDKIVSFTTTLYEPPEVLTRDDIEIAASVIASAEGGEEGTRIVSDFIEQKAPESASRVLQVVQKRIEEQKEAAAAQTPSTPSSPVPPVKTDPTPEELVEQEKEKEEIVQEFEQIFNTTFLDFRAEIFGKASNLCGYERQKGKDSDARLDLVREISRRLRADFPEAWDNLAEQNYLADGQSEEAFSCNLVTVFQGAEDAQMIVQRLNQHELSRGPDFQEIRNEALSKLLKSAQTNNEANRKYVSQLLIQHFNQKARQMSEYWNTTRYLYEGRNDEQYFDRIQEALTQSESWEEFGASLTLFYQAMQEPEVPAEEPEDTSEGDDSGEEGFTGTGSTVDNPPGDE
ncbi:hypothetical protein K9M59_01830 [Candidatus Gracilibacteria bacterium]|nr:hypothetical protein [Candidatus Gracilibacteria bacterium]MCF7819589.1 hypothetical protein [Candidatus Gracilibacteria bacterium]